MLFDGRVRHRAAGGVFQHHNLAAQIRGEKADGFLQQIAFQHRLDTRADAFGDAFRIVNARDLTGPCRATLPLHPFTVQRIAKHQTFSMQNTAQLANLEDIHQDRVARAGPQRQRRGQHHEGSKKFMHHRS